MKLFKVNSGNDAFELIRNLEKIGKISILRIDRDDTISVLNDLKWIEDNFISLLKLREEKFKRFKLLIDPENKLKKVSFESIDWNKVDFSKIKVTRIHEQLSEEDKRYRKRYNSPQEPNKNDVIAKYVEVIFSIWNKSNEKKNFAIQKYCVYIFANWVGVIDRQKDDKIDFHIVIRYFLNSITRLNWSILEEKELHPLYRFLSFNIYLEKIFDDELNHSNTSLYFEYLFENIYLGQKLGHDEVANEFIERCIDSTFYPTTDFGRYSDLYTLLDQKYRDIGWQYEQISNRLKPVPEFGFYALRYLRNSTEYSSWEDGFDQFISDIRTEINFNAEIISRITEIKELAYKILNFNRLQITVLKVAAYSIFKNNKKIIKHALEFNQPSDSNATWGNRDILPDSLSEILNYLTFHYSIEDELLKYWDGHHGITDYLDKLFLILFYEYKPQKKYNLEDPKHITKEFCTNRLKNDSTSISSLKSQSEHLLNKLESHFKAQSEFLKTYIPIEGKIIKASTLLKDIIATCDLKLTEIQTSAEIKAETKERFLKGCVEQYQKFNFLYQLFQKYQKQNHLPPEGTIYINPGVNELLDRTAFIENWHVPYYGLIESIGTAMAESENNIGLGAIRRLTSSAPTGKIREHQILDVIKQAKLVNKLVIGVNIYFDSVFRDENNFVPVWKNKDGELIPNFYIGKIDETLIFNLYDRVFTNKILFIISSNDLLGAIHQPLEDLQGFTDNSSFKYRFIDFSYDEAERNAFLDKAPRWLSDQIADKPNQETFLKNKVWVQILKKIYFNVSDTKNGLFYEVE